MKQRQHGVLPRLVRMDDPVRMYLRQMGQIPLVPREEEIRLAKEIEGAENRFRQTVFDCPRAKKEILNVANKIIKGEINLEDVVREEPSLNRDKLLKKTSHLISKLRATRKQANIASLLWQFDMITSMIEKIAVRIKSAFHQIKEIDSELKRLRRRKIRGKIGVLIRKKKKALKELGEPYPKLKEKIKLIGIIILNQKLL